MPLVRGAFGLSLLIAPEAMLGSAHDRRSDIFGRVLGARHLAEAVTIGRRRGSRWPLVAATVDATHAVTMVALAVAVPDRRRLALANALTASALAGASLVEARVA